tara:strand:- start:19874 stop:34459 length:14586 start_codon:yes stop_codon:yes gene_type:complete
MSLKDLFESTKVTKSGSADETAYEVESDAYTDAFVQDKNEYVPPVDFSTASNFARYGSAAKYYEDSIQRIYNSYPYDGSKYEVLDFHNSSSFLDRWMLEYKYPRSTGYVHLGTTSGSGDWLSMVSESSGVGGYGMPDTTSNNILEYIEIKGGPNTGSADRTFETQDVQLKKLFDFSNVYDSGSAREYNLEYDLRTGMTVEFWMLKNSFYTSKTEREVVFDLWNNENSSSAGYGRLMIELSGGSDAGSSIRLTAQSGTSGFVNEPLATLTPSEVADGVWKHYAITLKNHANNDGITAKLYVNGQVSGSAKLGSTGLGRVTGSMMATIGALIAPPSGATGFYDSTTIAKGGAKLSASLDEFRFWKLERDPRQIGRYWFTQVGGGTNTDKANVGLGVYYKFNEGIMNSGSRDRTVLDYSGRISNGFWKGGVAECRNSGSAMASGSHNMNEFHDPIIYSEHPDVEDLEIAMVASGTLHDNLNNSLITSNFPDWIDTESRTTTLKHFTQIFASYFDKLHMQIEGLGKLKDRYGSSYSSGDVSASFKPVPFAKNLVTQFGIAVPEILQEAELIENFLNRNEVEEYEEKLYNIRNQIYSNIYANLLYVFKTKGTEKSMRNMLRCFGVDDELVKINAYADNSDYVFKDNRRATSNKTNYVTFNHSDRIAGTVYQAVSMSVDGVYSNPNARAYITGSSGFGEYNAQTIECEVFFPLKTEDILSKQWYPDTFVTASMFGAKGTVESQTDTRFPTESPVDLKVFALKDKLESKRARFMLKSDRLGTLTTDYYEDVYDDTRWNFAVRVKPTKHPWVDHISGSDGALGDQTFDVEFYGVNVFTDVVQHEFLKTTTVSEAVGKAFLSSSKRCYVGALHTDFTGSTEYYSNVEVGNLRYWFSDVSDDVVLTHAMDQSSFGVESPYKNAFIYQTSMSGNYVPQIATLALHWNFDNVTGSGPSPTTTENTKDAQFIVQDISSGSAEHGERYEPAFSDQVMMQHLGIGDFFLENKKDIVNTRYIPTAKVVLPEYLHSSDMVEIRQNDDEFFTIDTRPSKVYYSIEKSMYQTISEEMVKMFSSIKDFDNLIGEPVNRYRPKYKDLGKLRQLFFEKMPNSPDLDKYVDYYKWIDSAVSRFLEDLFPASAEHSEGMQTMVESHMLERNKYETKFPSMEMADDPPAASFDTINTLLYDYQRGHAPVPLAPGGAEMMDQDDNCLWWSKRAEREHPILASTALSASSPGMNLSGTLTSRIAIFSASTSAFNRKLHTPYKYSVDQTRIIHGGINYDDNKKLDYVYPATVPFSPRGVDYGKFGGYPLGYLVAKDMDTDASPSASLPQCDMPRSASYGAKVKREGYRVMDGWEGFKSQAGNQAYVAPIAASGTVTVTNSADLYDIGIHKVLLQLTTTDGTVVSVYQAGAKDFTDANNPIIERIDASINSDSWREGYGYRIFEALNNHPKLTAAFTGEVGGAFPFVTVTQAEAGISGNRSIILTGSVPGSSTTFETNGLESTPLQGGQEGVTPTPSWGSGSYIHFRGNLVMPFNVISSSADDVNEGYTKLINQDLTVWGGGTGVGHSTDAGTYINKRSHAYGLHESRTGDDDDGSATATELGGLGRGVNLVNLHTDTYGEDKETPMQGPFTEKYVGGRKYRHAAINDGTDTLKNRMEGWLVLINTALSTSSGILHATSGGVGLTGPDYPFPHGPYPFQADDGGGGNSIHWRPIGGRYYRDEVAKRPVNIRNIQMVTSSAKTAVIGEHRVDVIASDGDDESSWTKHYHEQIATGSAITVLGNYRHNYEVVHTVGRSNQKPFLRDNQSVRNISQTGSAYEIGSNPAVGGRWQLIDGVVDGEIDYGAWYAPDDTDLTKLGQVSSSVRTGADSGARPIDLLATTHVETILTMPQRFWTDKDQDGNLLLHDLQDKINHASFDYSQTGAQQIHFKIIPKLRRTDFGDGEDQHAFIYTNFQVQSRESGSTNLNTIIANRFSAPGGPRNQSKGFLDLAAEEYSVYNAYPWRNLEVLGSSSGEYLSTKAEIHSSSHHPRLGLRSLRAMPSGRFGVENVVGQDTEIQDHSHDYGVSPSWHKVHRNGRLEHRNVTPLHGINTEKVEKRIYDNDYVTRPIPQNEYQYAWISASLAPSGANSTYFNLGHGYNIQGLNHPTPSGSRPVDPIIFISASDAGSSIAGEDTHATSADQGFRYFGIAKGLGTEHIPNVHRLNLNIRETQNNWLTDGSGAVALGFYASGGILPADDPLPIGHNTGESRGGFAYASRIANLHNYVNFAIQFGKGLRVLSSDKNGDAIMLSSIVPNEDPLYLQGAFVQDNDGTGLWRNEPIRWDILPQYWSGSSGYWSDVSLTGPNYTDSTDYHEEYAIRQSVGSIFNSLMWKRNGPYGYPTWKQIRGGEHELAQTMRKNNRYVVVDPRSDRVVPPKPGFVGRVRSLRRMQGSDAVAAFRKLGHINTAERKHHHYYVPVVETNAKTMLAAIHRGALTATWSSAQVAQGLDLLSPGGITPSSAPSVSYSVDPDKMLYANVTHVNNLKYFPDSQLNEDVGLRNFKTDRTAYNDLYEMYTEMTDLGGDDAYTLVDLTYRETVFPQSHHASHTDMRKRANYVAGFWAADESAVHVDPDDHASRRSFVDPVGRRTYYDHPDTRNARGVWKFSRGDGANFRRTIYRGGAWHFVDAFEVSEGEIQEALKAENKVALRASASVWPMDGAVDIGTIAGYQGTIGIGPAQYRASASAANINRSEPFTMNVGVTDAYTLGAPGILQNQHTWFHNGMAYGFDAEYINNLNRAAVVSSSTLSQDDFNDIAQQVGIYKEDLFQNEITERYVEGPAAGMAFGPSYARPHMLVGRDSYCSPSAGKAAYSRRFNFTSETATLSGAASYGKGDGIAPFFTALDTNKATIPFTSSIASAVLNFGDRIVSQLTRSIGHDVEGLYVSDWKWKAPEQSGKAPFYENYAKWFEELRGKSQDRQVLPEYRISDRIPYFVLDKQGRFTSRDSQWLSIHGNPSSSVGALTSSSDTTSIAGTITGSFMSDYAVTANASLLDAIKTENAGIAEPYELTLTCDAVVKFLPYQGFYPQLRTVDLCKQFIDSYDEHVTFESDLGINDLPSSFVRADTSGSVSNTFDAFGSARSDSTPWFAFSPFEWSAELGFHGGFLGYTGGNSSDVAAYGFIYLKWNSYFELDDGNSFDIKDDDDVVVRFEYDTARSFNSFAEISPVPDSYSGINKLYRWRGPVMNTVDNNVLLNRPYITATVLRNAINDAHGNGYINVYAPYQASLIGGFQVAIKIMYETDHGSPDADGTPGTAGNACQFRTKGITSTEGSPSSFFGSITSWKNFENGESALATIDAGFARANFYSDEDFSAYNFDIDQIQDPTNQRVGGSGKLTAEGYETHGRNPAAAKRPFYGPFMAPGILFNTIKSGIAVDYPVLHRKLATTASVDRDGGRNYQILNEYFDNRLPFETLVEPEKYLTNVPLIDMEPHPSASINVTASWNGQGDPLYKMMMHNFLAEIPNFYLAEQSMQSFVSLPESDNNFGQVSAVVHNGEQVIPEYRMMVKLWKSQALAKRKLTPSASNHWQNHRGPLKPLTTTALDNSNSGTLVFNGGYQPCYTTDYIQMERMGFGSEGGTGPGYMIDLYRSPDGVNYSREESLYPRPQNDAPETITMYSRPSAFGPPCAGGYAFEPELHYIYTGSVAPMSMSYGATSDADVPAGSHVPGSGTVGKVSWHHGTTHGMKDGTTGYNAPFTPPYYDGQAWAFITFKPTRTGKHYLDDIWEQSTINFLRYELDYVSGAYGDWGTIGPQGYAINVNAMQIDAAVNIKGRTQIKEVAYDATTGLPQTVQDSNQTTARNSAWVIQTKLETPILHFGYGLTDNQSAPTLSGSISTAAFSESNGYHHGYAGLCEPIGMWHQYGEIPSASQGIYLEVSDIPLSYLQNGTEMTIPNPKWLHITGSPDFNAGAGANIVKWGDGADGSGDPVIYRGGLDWDGHQSGTFTDSIVNGGSASKRLLLGMGYRQSGSFSGSEQAYVVGRDTIRFPDKVADGTLERGGRQQYMRWRLMSTGSLAGIIADHTHLQILSADDGTILDTTWGVTLHPNASTPGLSGSNMPAFERGFYIDASVTGSNIMSGSAHAGGDNVVHGDGEYGPPAHADQMTYLNRGYPGTSSLRQKLMGIGKLPSTYSEDANRAIQLMGIPFRNYYTQWKFDVPNNPNVDKKNLAASYQSELHKNKRGVIPNPPHFSNNISTGSFGDALGATLYTHQLMNTHPYQTCKIGYSVYYFENTGSHNTHLNTVTHKGPGTGRGLPANGFEAGAADYQVPLSNSIGVGRAEIICGYTGSEGIYGVDADGNFEKAIAPRYERYARSIDSPLSGNHPRYPNTNFAYSGYTHGETSYQRYASDYYGEAAGSASNKSNVFGFHNDTVASDATEAGDLQDIYPLGMMGYAQGSTHNEEIERMDPIKLWYTNPVHIANLRYADNLYRHPNGGGGSVTHAGTDSTLDYFSSEKIMAKFPDLEAALNSPRTVPSGKFLPRAGVPALTRSLGSLVGFNIGAKKLGQVAETKKVKEAVIVMPYVMAGPNRSRRRFVELNRDQIDRYFGRNDFSNTAYWASLEKLRGLEGTAVSPVSGLQVNLGASVLRQITLMQDYIIPPHLDFTRTTTAKPYAMYIFEYEHEFSAQDLADMWQGLYPDSGKIMKQVTKQVSHKLNVLELLGAAAEDGGDLPNQLRFMVFKVKQRAEINYFAQTTDSLDDDRFKFKFKAGEARRATEYSYNWPYDFFSLVETAKIDMSVTLRNKKLIENIQLQELNERLELGTRASSIADLSLRSSTSMSIISISETTVRTAARNATTSMATAAISATYGTPSPAAGVTPSSGPTLSGPTRGGY